MPRSTRNPATSNDWLDNDGYFLFGEHEGDDVHVVVRNDPSYVRYVLKNYVVSDEDTQVMLAALRLKR